MPEGPAAGAGEGKYSGSWMILKWRTASHRPVKSERRIPTRRMSPPRMREIAMGNRMARKPARARRLRSGFEGWEVA
jgi:hypothetical protein